jgi:hypothetical protein
MTKVSSQVRLPDPAVPGSLLIRFRRTAMLVQVIGATLLVAGVAGATYALSTGRLDDFRYVEFLEPVTLASAVAAASGAMLLLAGISRTTQVRHSRGVAFAVDPVGVYLGAERGGGRPVFVPWSDVRALVLCEATKGPPDQTIRRSVGVLLHPGHPHGMRAFFDRLSRVDLRTLPRRRRDEARVALTRVRELGRDPDELVTFALPVHGWSVPWAELPAVVGRLRPNIPVVRSGDYPHWWTGWRNRLEQYGR